MLPKIFNIFSPQALCVLAKYTNRFEFVFTSLVKNSPRLFTTVQAVMRAYETSKLYRDLKLRGSIVKDGELILLPDEQVIQKS
jgi:Bardet-Biedl syndrome 5 protein